MRSIRFVIVLALVSGCAIQQLTDDMMYSRFLEATPIAIDIGGTYSGTIGPYVVTYRIANDGTGLSCYYQNGIAVIHRVKIYSRKGHAYSLIHETGTIGVLRPEGEGSFDFESYGQKHKLLPDKDLVLSNLNCKARLLQTN